VFSIPVWPHFLGVPAAAGAIRTTADDFFVEEIPRVIPEGEGGHLWLWVEKRAANTDWVARELAKAASCSPRDVGFAGLKDRHAVTRQWFSVPIGETLVQKLESADIDGVQLLEYQYHSRKLKRGTLNGNRFQLNIRNFRGSASEVERRLKQIRQHGVPNYFGPQRFGHEGRNVEKAYSLLKKRARLQRSKKSIYLSAIRSFMFNQVLAERVLNGSWNTILDGELAMLEGTHSIFPCEMPDLDIEERCAHLDIHPTGPMPGEGGTLPLAKAAELEQAVLKKWPELAEVLVEQRVTASRRALRLFPANLQWSFGDNSLELGFELPPGTYATTVLREILLTDEKQPG
jgi:tRNA pseudouridine13 synthase